MTAQVAEGDDGPEWCLARVSFLAGAYRHPPAGLVQLRLVCTGSSYVRMDLGAGPRRAFTRPGDLILSLPDRATMFELEERRDLLVVQLRTDFVARLASDAGGSGPNDLVPLLEGPFREPLAAELCRRLEGAAHRTPSVQGWILGSLFTALLDASSARTSARRRKTLTGPGLRAVVERIEAQSDANPSVESLSKLAGLPRRRFAAAFREATALPVHQFVLRRRVERAAELLRSSSAPLAEVALRAGFANQAHMSRVLKKMLGLTPGVIRNGRS